MSLKVKSSTRSPIFTTLAGAFPASLLASLSGAFSALASEASVTSNATAKNHLHVDCMTGVLLSRFGGPPTPWKVPLLIPRRPGRLQRKRGGEKTTAETPLVRPLDVDQPAFVQLHVFDRVAAAGIRH